MFIYENGNSLNLTFKGSIPVKTPDLVIEGFMNGAKLTVGNTTIGAGTEAFEGKAKTLVYQKDGKLIVTFRGIAGMDKPEVVIDAVDDNKYSVTVDGQQVTLVVETDTITVEGTNTVEEPVKEPEVTEPTESEEDPEEVVEE